MKRHVMIVDDDPCICAVLDAPASSDPSRWVAMGTPMLFEGQEFGSTVPFLSSRPTTRLWPPGRAMFLASFRRPGRRRPSEQTIPPIRRRSRSASSTSQRGTPKGSPFTATSSILRRDDPTVHARCRYAIDGAVLGESVRTSQESLAPPPFPRDAPHLATWGSGAPLWRKWRRRGVFVWVGRQDDVDRSEGTRLGCCIGPSKMDDRHPGIPAIPRDVALSAEQSAAIAVEMAEVRRDAEGRPSVETRPIVKSRRRRP
jgi:hypothetical protein